MTLYGFKDKPIAEKLRDFAQNCDMQCVSSDALQMPRRPQGPSRTFYAIVDDDIPAGTLSSRSPMKIVPGQGTGKLAMLTLDYVGNGDIEAYDDDVEIDIYNYNLYPLKIIQNEIVLVHQTRDGNYALDPGVVNRPFCQFKLSAALTTSTASVAATKVATWGAGLDHDVSTVYNTATHTSGTYKFAGDANDIGEAYWDPVTEKWYIIQLEC